MEQAVWRRVQGGSPIRAEEALLPERLEAMIVEQQADAAELGALSRRLRGPSGGALVRQARQAEARVRWLTTLHYLLTGRRLRLQGPKPSPKPAPLPEALRGACLRAQQSERAYRALGEEFSDYAGAFSQKAAEASALGRTLLNALQAQLNGKYFPQTEK